MESAPIARLFQAWDSDRSGSVCRNELRQLLRFVTDGAIDEGMVDRLMANADVDGNGAIDFDEFFDWMLDPRTGSFSKDIAPSRIECGTSPSILEALQNWFHVLDMNRNGSLDFEEFAVCRIAVQPNITMDEIDAEFSSLDINGDRRISRQEFFQKHLRLLEAIPRPIEEKVSMINLRASRLAQALHEDEKKWRDHKPLTRKGFRKLLKDRYGSLQAAVEHLDVDSSGKFNILELRSVVGDLLGISPGTQYPLQYLRMLYLSLDADRSGGITLEDIVDPLFLSDERRPSPKECQVSQRERCQSSREQRPSNANRPPGRYRTKESGRQLDSDAAVFSAKHAREASTLLGTVTSVGDDSRLMGSVALAPTNRKHAAAVIGPRATSRTLDRGHVKSAPGRSLFTQGPPSLRPLSQHDSQLPSARRHPDGHCGTRGAGHFHEIAGAAESPSNTTLQTRPNSSHFRGKGICMEVPATFAAGVRQQAPATAGHCVETRRSSSPAASKALRRLR